MPHHFLEPNDGIVFDFGFKRLGFVNDAVTYMAAPDALPDVARNGPPTAEGHTFGSAVRRGEGAHRLGYDDRRLSVARRQAHSDARTLV